MYIYHFLIELIIKQYILDTELLRDPSKEIEYKKSFL